MSPPGRAEVHPALLGIAALALTACVAGAALLLGGHSPVAAGNALLTGTFGSMDRFLSITLVRAVPLILAGVAVALAFRGGVMNIGAEGQLLVGAIAATWVGLPGFPVPDPLRLPAAMAAAFLAGGLWALVPALLRLRRGVGEVISTLLMNFTAIQLLAWMVQGPLREPRGVFPQSESIVPAARLPVLVEGTRLHAGILLAVGVAAGVWILFRFSAAGFRIRATGASPEAARVSGRIDTRRVLLGTFLLSGGIAGLTGGTEVAGVTWALYEGLSPGTGYTAIAVALLAGLHPLGVLASGVLFGALQGGAGAMQRIAGIPPAWVGVVEAMAILAIVGVAVASKRFPQPPGVRAAEEA